MVAPDDQLLANEILEPFLHRRLSSGNFVTIDALREAFFVRGRTLGEFTRGMKVLLDGHILKRVNDHELGLGSAGAEYSRLHWPDLEPPQTA